MSQSNVRHLSPKKLLLSKWTAIAPAQREKHFIVTRVIEPKLRVGGIEYVELEAIHTRRSFTLPWRKLRDRSCWLQGWH